MPRGGAATDALVQTLMHTCKLVIIKITEGFTQPCCLAHAQPIAVCINGDKLISTMNAFAYVLFDGGRLYFPER